MYSSYPFYCPYKWRIDTQKFAAVTGIVTRIEDFNQSPDDASAGCYKLMSIESSDKGSVNFVISPETYFVDYEVINEGDTVTGFYDANAPAILIYPPQYPAIVVAKDTEYQNVAFDYFDNQLVSSSGSLKLNLAPSTEIILKNNQPFNKYPGNRNLIVIYGPSTKSIPAQTTPYKVIVMC